MIGAITNIDALRRWFDSNGLPFFTLRYEGANNERIIMRNDSIEDMEKAWQMLEDQVTAQAEVGRARLVVFVYKKGGHNNGIYTNIDLRPGYPTPGTQAAVSGMPAGMGSIAEYVDNRVHLAKLEWENEQLREQLNAPANVFERTMETISGIPGVADVLKILVAGLVGKINPEAMPQIQAVLNGTPAATGTPDRDDDDDNAHNGAADPQQQFADNINQTAELLGVDPLTLSAKLKALVKQNPEVAKQWL